MVETNAVGVAKKEPHRTKKNDLDGRMGHQSPHGGRRGRRVRVRRFQFRHSGFQCRDRVAIATAAAVATVATGRTRGTLTGKEKLVQVFLNKRMGQVDVCGFLDEIKILEQFRQNNHGPTKLSGGRTKQVAGTVDRESFQSVGLFAHQGRKDRGKAMAGDPKIHQHGTVGRNRTFIKGKLKTIGAKKVARAMHRDAKGHAFGRHGHVPKRAHRVLGRDGKQQRTIERQSAQIHDAAKRNVIHDHVFGHSGPYVDLGHGKVVVDKVPTEDGDGKKVPERKVSDRFGIQDVVHDQTTERGKDCFDDVARPVARRAVGADTV